MNAYVLGQIVTLLAIHPMKDAMAQIGAGLAVVSSVALFAVRRRAPTGRELLILLVGSFSAAAVITLIWELATKT